MAEEILPLRARLQRVHHAAVVALRPGAHQRDEKQEVKVAQVPAFPPGDLGGEPVRDSRELWPTLCWGSTFDAPWGTLVRRELCSLTLAG